MNLEVVRDFCHLNCRLDTFNSNQRIYVRNYNDSYEYHQVHIRCESLEEYFEMFQKDPLYLNWRKENKTINRKNMVIFPTIKLRSFSTAFCPCCLNQRQRDCANHVQVSLQNALKGLGKLRRLRGVSQAMKTCGCSAHKNENYLKCHTSINDLKVQYRK